MIARAEQIVKYAGRAHAPRFRRFGWTPADIRQECRVIVLSNPGVSPSPPLQTPQKIDHAAPNDLAQDRRWEIERATRTEECQVLPL